MKRYSILLSRRGKPLHFLIPINCKAMMDKGLLEPLGYDYFRYFFLPSIRRAIEKFELKNEKKAILDETFVLGDFGFDEVILKLTSEYLHRVFTRGNKKFIYGGRFYGPCYQGMPKPIRNLIQINGKQTVEIDYSAFHIRMLYHMEGIDYREDPYSIGNDEREWYKITSLIAINAKNERSAKSAVKDEFYQKGLTLPPVKEPLNYLFRTFKKTHKPIEKYLSSDIGIRFQNKDSMIMDRVLCELMNLGILGLPVHDSVIVQAEYYDVTKQIMIAAYRDEFGFDPMF